MKKMLLVVAMLGLSSLAFAQAPVVSLSITPTSGSGSVVPKATWLTAPVATFCRGSWQTAGSANLAASGTNVTLPTLTSTTDLTLVCTGQGSLGTATVSWTPPTTNTDGSALTDLASFKILYGTSATTLTSAAVAPSTSSSSSIGNLTPATTYFFVVRAVNSAGVESADSNVAQKMISGGTAPTGSKTVTVTVNKVPGVPTNTTVIETTAYNVVPDLLHFAFLRGSRVGSVNIGAACDESRVTDDGYTVISRNNQVTPRPPKGSVLVARCG